VWLAAHDNVLTWEAIQRKGWKGPGVCKLCNCNAENTSHLLIHSSFTKSVWLQLYEVYNIKIQWVGSSVSDCFDEWTIEKSAPASLVAIVCWHIWIEINKAIFEEHRPSHFSVVHSISVTFSWQPVITNPLPNRACDITHTCDISHREDFTLACFDGVALSMGKCCAAGGFFKTHASRVTKWYINCRADTNTKVELMGLWATLTLASLWAIDQIQILGDSKVIIDWINQKGQLLAVNI
jgi:hypothetical protein